MGLMLYVVTANKKKKVLAILTMKKMLDSAKLRNDLIWFFNVWFC